MHQILHNIGYTLGISHRLARMHPAPRIIMFHGVEPRSLSLEIFSSLLSYINKHYEIISLHDLLQNRSFKSSKIKVALTFDDGLKNNYTTVYPILQKYDLPATFFVCPDLIKQAKWLWNHQARAQISRLSKPQSRSFTKEIKSYKYEKGDIIEWMKTINPQHRNKVNELLTNLTPTFRPTQEEKESYDIMSSDELLKLDPKLISIGSHTKSHPILSGLDSAALLDEIGNSKAELEDMIDRPVYHFCYPNGVFTEVAAAMVREHYEAAVTTVKGLFLNDSSPFEIPRIGAANSAAYQAWRMWRPGS